MKKVTLSVTTAADGTGTVASEAFNCALFGVHYDKGTFAAGVDITISVVKSKHTYTILTLTDANTSASYYPRVATCGSTGVADGGTTLPPILGQIQVSVAAGGDTKTGEITFDLVEV